MALVKVRDVTQDGGPPLSSSTRRVSSRNGLTPRSTKPIDVKICPSDRPVTSYQSGKSSRQQFVAKLPERQLLSRYRHVYAGKGGWYVGRTSLTPPVNFNTGSNLDIYKKGVILKISKDIFENNKHQLRKDSVVSNRVLGDGDQISSANKSSSGEKIPNDENTPDRLADRQISNGIKTEDERSGSNPKNTDCQDIELSVNESLNGLNRSAIEKGQDTCSSEIENCVNNEANCFITKLHRAKTSIGSFRTKDSLDIGNNYERNLHRLENNRTDIEFNEEKELKGHLADNVVSENTEELGSVEKISLSNGNRKRAKNKQSLGDLELSVLRQRSFVKTHSKMTKLDERPGSRGGALTHSGKFLPTRMSQEALLAINETRIEMGINHVDNSEESFKQESEEYDVIRDPIPEKEIHNFKENNKVSWKSDHMGSDVRSKQPSSESFKSSKDSFKMTSPNGRLKVTSADEMKQAIKNAPRKTTTTRGLTEATSISPELRQVPAMSSAKKQSSSRFSFNLQTDKHSPRVSNRRYLNINNQLKSSSRENLRMIPNSPRGKLPSLKLAASCENISQNQNGIISQRSRASLNKYSSDVALAEADDNIAPLDSKKKFPSWKQRNGLKFTKEKSFQITPPGWDERYKDIYLKSSRVDFNDDTPEEVKAHAIEKCSDWLVKYM